MIDLVSLLTFLLGLGFTEGIVKPFSILFFKKSLSLLPQLFDYLDPFMPEGIAKWTPEQMRSFIQGAINKLAKDNKIELTQTEKDKLFKEFISRYNPVIAASKVTDPYK